MKQNNYTATDIERYHSGQLSPAERHALEKAALTDPFLNDALDGFSFTKTPATDLQTLQQKLQQRVEEQEQKKVFRLSNQWLKIAALFIVMAGGGWLVINSLSTKNENKNVAQKIETPKPEEKTLTYKLDDSAIKADTSRLSSKTVSSKRLTKDYETQYDKRSTAPTIVNNGDLKKKNVDSPSLFDIAAQTNTSTFQPSRFKLDSPALKVGRSNDKEETYAFKSKAGMINSDTIKNINIVLQRAASAPYDVVVLSKSKRAPRNRNEVIAGNVKIDTLQPAEGWTNFDDYIASNIKSPEQLQIKPVSGEVELTFEINKEGDPVNIAVTKSLCEKCDAEAVRLLKEGPKWVNKKRMGKIKIKF